MLFLYFDLLIFLLDFFFEIDIYRKIFYSDKKRRHFAKISSEKSLIYVIKYLNINNYVSVPTEPMTIHDSIIESIPYWFQIRGMLW